MSKALSVDLRSRVVEAIEQGLSRRQAADRFGVSAASAIRWHAQFRAEGHVTPRAQGGDRKSGRIEAEAEFILGEVAAASDITLNELKVKLAERGENFGIGTLWRFFERRRITFKKRRRMPVSSSAPM